VIAYSPEAQAARAHLLKMYNDVDVFVEDATCQNMYIRLISRILGRRGRISQVYPLGGRDSVIEKCRGDQGLPARRRLYVVDADMDLILGRPSLRLQHYYRLGLYCSENLLLSEHAFITIAAEARINMPWLTLAASMALQPLLERGVRVLLPLFVVYGVAHELGLGIETTGYPVQRLLTDPNNPATLSEGLVRARTLSIVRQIRSQVPARKYRTTRNSILRRISRSRRDHSVYISGKTYLLPLACLQLRRIAGVNDSMDRIKVRLAQHCELTIDRGLARALRAAAR